MCLCEADILQILVGIFNDRWEFVRMDRGNFLDHIRNLIGVRNDNFLSFLTSQIGEFLQHFFRSTQI